MENNNNTKKQKHIFNLSADVFFQVWKKQFESRLIQVFEMHIDRHNEMGIPVLEFEDFCMVAYQVQPSAIETNYN